MWSSISPGASRSPPKSSAPRRHGPAGVDGGDAAVANEEAAGDGLGLEHKAGVGEDELPRLRLADVVWHVDTMSEWRRHAIYFAPEPGPLARFGAEWLGWDPETGVGAEPASGLPGLLAARRQLITARPRRYGFHATLKAPFRLAEGARPTASTRRRGAGGGRGLLRLRLRVAAIGRLRRAGAGRAPPRSSAALAAACVTRLDRFRAPPPAAELARRRAARLDAVGEANSGAGATRRSSTASAST